MPKSSSRRGPSPPRVITASASDRQLPSTWGVRAEILNLETSADVDLVHGNQNQVLAAKRSDPFDLLHAAGGLDDGQHIAARRLFRDWCLRAGVKDREHLVLERIDGGRLDPSSMVTDAMVDAGRRLAAALKGDPRNNLQGVGPVNAKLFEALISPMVDEGRIIAWRGVVQRVTGETERHVQGGLVRQACEALRLVYESADELARRRRQVQAVA